jgi:pimeloyl-ACP methyl ester carboxylesterase
MIYRPRRVPRHSMLRLRGIDTHLTQWGPADRAPLVFLHGFLDTSDTFQFLVDAFAGDHPIIAPDWRGFGRSGRGPGSYWFPDYIADLDALLEVVAPGAPATLVGHSMGGNVAALYGGIRPERVARVANLEGYGLPDTRPEDAPGRYRRWLEELRREPGEARYASLEEFAALLQRRNPRLPPERARYIADSWTRARPDGGYALSADPAHRLVNPVLYRRAEAESCWRRCVAPVLLVRGGVSDAPARLGAASADEYYRSIYPNVTIATLPQAGHMLHHEQPEALARLVEPFLAS